ncbi:hypothetical protein NT6N_36180 [Oceaniferula spumae]|uniref:Uncharacterized protein n=1 Tax=Oceaniferula spumae TaxID=2979115 RepID=A0AAT9FRL2_9BACT
MLFFMAMGVNFIPMLVLAGFVMPVVDAVFHVRINGREVNMELVFTC